MPAAAVDATHDDDDGNDDADVMADGRTRTHSGDRDRQMQFGLKGRSSSDICLLLLPLAHKVHTRNRVQLDCFAKLTN